MVLVAVGKALDELAALLHDGQVGGEIGVEYIVEAHGFQGRHHPLRRGVLGVQVEEFRPGRPNGGGHLHHGDALGIGQSVKHLAGVVVLLQTAHGTVGDALTAERAVALAQRAGTGHAYGGVGAGAHQVPDAHGLHLVADLDAAHALDAAVLQPDDGVGEVVGDVPKILDVVLAQQVVVIGELLELAVAAAGALGTADVVLGQQQPQVYAPRLADAGGVGVDHHAPGHHVVAGGDQTGLPLHLHGADAAGADLIDALEIAQSGDLDMDAAGRLQNGGVLRHRDGMAIDGQRYHLTFLPPLKIP